MAHLNHFLEHLACKYIIQDVTSGAEVTQFHGNLPQTFGTFKSKKQLSHNDFVQIATHVFSNYNVFSICDSCLLPHEPSLIESVVQDYRQYRETPRETGSEPDRETPRETEYELPRTPRDTQQILCDSKLDTSTTFFVDTLGSMSDALVSAFGSTSEQIDEKFRYEWKFRFVYCKKSYIFSVYDWKTWENPDDFHIASTTTNAKVNNAFKQELVRVAQNVSSCSCCDV